MGAYGAHADEQLEACRTARAKAEARVAELQAALEESGRAERLEARVAEAETLLREVRRYYLPSGDDYATHEDERAVRLIEAFLAGAPAAPPDKSWESLPVGPGSRCPECGSRAGLVPPHREWCSRGKAPAAPPEPPCDCGHGAESHNGDDSSMACEVCDCGSYTPPPPSLPPEVQRVVEIACKYHLRGELPDELDAALDDFVAALRARKEASE